MKRTRPPLEHTDERLQLPDPAKVAARGYKRWRVVDLERCTETEWPIVEMTDGVRRWFAWGDPIRGENPLA